MRQKEDTRRPQEVCICLALIFPESGGKNQKVTHESVRIVAPHSRQDMVFIPGKSGLASDDSHSLRSKTLLEKTMFNRSILDNPQKSRSHHGCEFFYNIVEGGRNA